MLADLLGEYGSERILFKPEATPIGPRLSALRDATKGKRRSSKAPAASRLVDSYRRGIVGTMPGADLITAIVALWKALEAGNDARVTRIGSLLTDIVSLQCGLDGFLAIEKHLLAADRARVSSPSRR